jgi:hypothetical protein
VNVNGTLDGTTSNNDGVPRRVGIGWALNNAQLWVNGAVEAQDVTVTECAAMNQISIGITQANAIQPKFPALIRRVRVYNTFPPNMAALTGGAL